LERSRAEGVDEVADLGRDGVVGGVIEGRSDLVAEDFTIALPQSARGLLDGGDAQSESRS
jgi:hypothetical protein